MKIENIVDLVNLWRGEWKHAYCILPPTVLKVNRFTQSQFEKCVAEMTEAAWMDEQPSAQLSDEKLKEFDLNEFASNERGQLILKSVTTNGIKSDQVKSPKHYEVVPDVEAKQLIKNTLNSDITKNMTPYQIYCLGNTLKYRLRAGKKDNLQQDIDKAEQYVTMGWGE